MKCTLKQNPSDPEMVELWVALTGTRNALASVMHIDCLVDDEMRAVLTDENGDFEIEVEWVMK